MHAGEERARERGRRSEADDEAEPPRTAQRLFLNTSIGPFTVELYWKHAPKTCQNFIELARRGYYDGVPFHRIIAGFMIQGGDPTGTGRGGASIWGGKFEDEITRELKHTGAGIICMANSGPNTNGSQFYITLAPTPWLDGKHTNLRQGLRGHQDNRETGKGARTRGINRWRRSRSSGARCSITSRRGTDRDPA